MHLRGIKLKYPDAGKGIKGTLCHYSYGHTYKFTFPVILKKMDKNYAKYSTMIVQNYQNKGAQFVQ